MSYWRAEALSGDSNVKPISADKLATLIHLGWPDYRIASYFGIERSKVSGLRAYYGLASRTQVGLADFAALSRAAS